MPSHTASRAREQPGKYADTSRGAATCPASVAVCRSMSPLTSSGNLDLIPLNSPSGAVRIAGTQGASARRHSPKMEIPMGKTLAAITLLATAGLTLTACGEDSGDDATDSTSSASTTPMSPSPSR